MALFIACNATSSAYIHYIKFWPHRFWHCQSVINISTATGFNCSVSLHMPKCCVTQCIRKEGSTMRQGQRARRALRFAGDSYHIGSGIFAGLVLRVWAPTHRKVGHVDIVLLLLIGAYQELNKAGIHLLWRYTVLAKLHSKVIKSPILVGSFWALQSNHKPI